MSAARTLGALAEIGSPWAVAQAAGQLLLLPWNVFSCMVAAGLARLADEVNPAAGGREAMLSPPPAPPAPPRTTFPAAPVAILSNEWTTSGAMNASAGTTIHKETKMSYEDACGEADDCEIRLFSYTIVTIRRGCERVLYRGATLVTDPMDQCEFDAWVIAEYLQGPEYAKAKEEKKARGEGKKPREDDDDCLPVEDDLDRRWLRVSSEIQHTWGKQPLHYRERQLKLLQRIADKI